MNADSRMTPVARKSDSARKRNADPRWLHIQGTRVVRGVPPNQAENAERKDFEQGAIRWMANPSLELDLAASYFETRGGG